MIATAGLFPYQFGSALSKIHSDSTAELCPSSHSREVLYIEDEDRDEEEEADISSDKLSKVGKTGQQMAARRHNNNQHA